MRPRRASLLAVVMRCARDHAFV
ncbi:MAG: hypothetical protein JWN72_1169, partial [Thermoleophilia bacterium]|nr:hypothetical protein [Thermoleophilia bacterium]